MEVQLNVSFILHVINTGTSTYAVITIISSHVSFYNPSTVIWEWELGRIVNVIIKQLPHTVAAPHRRHSTTNSLGNDAPLFIFIILQSV